MPMNQDNLFECAFFVVVVKKTQQLLSRANERLLAGFAILTSVSACMRRFFRFSSFNQLTHSVCVSLFIKLVAVDRFIYWIYSRATHVRTIQPATYIQRRRRRSKRSTERGRETRCVYQPLNMQLLKFGCRTVCEKFNGRWVLNWQTYCRTCRMSSVCASVQSICITHFARSLLSFASNRNIFICFFHFDSICFVCMLSMRTWIFG